MVDLDTWVIHELLLLRVKLDTVKGILVGLHGCHEHLPLIIVA